MHNCVLNGGMVRGQDMRWYYCTDKASLVNNELFDFLAEVKKLVDNRGAVFQVNILGDAYLDEIMSDEDKEKIFSKLFLLNDNHSIIQPHPQGLRIFPTGYPKEQQMVFYF